jgi:methyl-accepting chemotaxis protein
MAISGVLLSGQAYFHMHTEELNGLARQVNSIGEQQSQMIGEWLAAKRRIVDATHKAALDPNPQPSLWRAKLAGEFGPVYLGFPDKRMVQGDPNTPIPPNFDPTVRPWYKLAVERGTLVTTAPFMSVSDKKLVITIAAPVQKDGSLYCVMGANVILDDLIKEVLAVKVVGDSHAFLVAKDGTVIAHPQNDSVLKNISSIVPELTVDRIESLAKNGEMMEITQNGKRDFVVIRAVPGSEWYFGLVVDRAAALGPLKFMLATLAGTTLLVLVVAIALANIGMRRLLRDIVNLRNVMLEISQGEGDLTVRLPVRSDDEVGQAARAFNQFLERLHGMFKEVRAQASEVNNEVSLVGQTASRVVRDFARQSEEMSSTAATIEEVTVSIGHIADTVREAETAMQNADGESAKSAESIERVTREITKVADTMNSLSTVVSRLGSRSDEISGIVGAIKEVAEQTNLLALNAAIEAARAGEQGRGFAVVADEVRKLAERTADATIEIGRMIDSIRSEMMSAVSGMSDAQAIVASGVELAEQATGGIRTIRGQVSGVVARMHDIAGATSEQAVATTEMAKRAEQVNSMIHSSSVTLSEAEQALRTANERATRLGQIVARFRL